MDTVESTPAVWFVFGATMLLAVSCVAEPAPADPACRDSTAGVARAAEYLIERDNERDLEGVLAGYTDDIVWLPPSGGAIAGKAAIGDRYRKLFSGYQPRLEPEILESYATNDLGYVRGFTRGVLEPRDGSPSTPVDDEFLAIVRCEEGRWRVSHLAWSPRSETSREPRNLTHHPASDRRPAWSPNGQTIAFESDRDGNWEIYLMDSDGADPRRVTDHPASDRRPWFSPDGSELVFQSDRDGDEEIFVMRVDGTHLRQLSDNDASDMFPAWAPDGSAIAFSSDRDGNLELYWMNSDGSAQTRLTDTPGRDLWPAWHPDASGIVFFSRGDDDQGNDDLYLIGENGAGLTAITSHPANDFCPTWASDGRRIAFASRGSFDRPQIHVFDLQTAQRQRLIDDPGRSTEPAWSPDGTRIAYVTNRDGNDEIYVARPSGE